MVPIPSLDLHYFLMPFRFCYVAMDWKTLSSTDSWFWLGVGNAQINTCKLIYNGTGSSLTPGLKCQARLEIIGQGNTKSISKNTYKSFY